MQKENSYHRDAVRYNEALAEAAEAVSAELDHPEPKQWATSVGKQHRFHQKRHQAALDKAEREQATGTTPVAVETPSIADEQAAFAAQQETTEVNNA